MNQPARPIRPPCSCAAVDLYPAFQAAAGDHQGGTSGPFPSDDLEVGEIDKRVILQTEYWIDPALRGHKLSTVTPAYCTRILIQLDAQSTEWIIHSRAHYILRTLAGTTEAAITSRQLELLDMLTPGWVHHTPLGHRLHELNHTDPSPIHVPTPARAAETDQPETLRDDDRGTWRVTTESTSTYEIDLDQRRIRRVPGHAGRNGQGPAPVDVRVSSLAHDREWLGLQTLVHCVIGQPLLALDERHVEGGYRISTAITCIQLMPTTPPSAPDHGR